MKYIDIHSHVYFPEFETDREEVIARAHEQDVGMIQVGTDYGTSKQAVELAAAQPNMWATIGLHPIHTVENEEKKAAESFDEEKLRELALHPKVVAIGECGLDFFHCTPEEVVVQRDVFEKHIALANSLGKPLMLHVRDGKSRTGQSAYMQAVEMLKAHAKVRANFHFFAGSVEDLKAILDIDCTVSFTGVITFARQYDDVIKMVPLTHVMSETDCPYVAPAPYRGKRNESLYVIEVVKAIAHIRGEDEESVARALVSNAQNFFKLQG